ncbi:hypothetical protein BD289DRAFT_370566 [Coniella lustricola]|uniref:Macro domain-containing protein n=1 Tax=Coniella lustricola TaxID=2025994 RepID=A0A2T3A533_9PEZI|nr:hypothetical protein BD289DRAFT_370566 [Coniella lustricola]
MAILSADELPSLSLLYKLGKLDPAPASRSSKVPTTLSIRPTGPIAPSQDLNNRVSLVRNDITKLAVEAICNAANRRLLGGGGVDGAIHRAAGPGLLAECRKLGGCATGDAKITDAYNLPCSKVIHAVGPVYDMQTPQESERLLTSAYNRVLNLAVDNDCSTLALCGISTGVYGYPHRKAAPVAISTVKKFLESEKGQKLKKVVFVVFVEADVEAHEEFLPVYFPPLEYGAKAATQSGSLNETEEVAEAKEVASKLPDVPTSEPGDSEHVDKRQKTSIG